MTTVELQATKQSLIEAILQIEDLHALERLRKYLNRLHPASKAEEDTISKEEILAGIDAGLKEVKLSMEGKLKLKTARELLNEL